jgi:regulator of protease activity HflC (stomatin/prohibitin superfamily)
MSSDEDVSAWKVILLGAVVVGIIVGVVCLFTLGTSVQTTEVGIVVNNITGSKSTYGNGGMVFHLPWGLSSVYKIDKSQRIIQMAHGSNIPDRTEVRVKTNDGSNISIDVSISFQVKTSMAAEVYRDLDDEKNIEDILTSLVRSEVRDHFGRLSTLEISEASLRTPKLKNIEEGLRAKMEPLGLEICAVTAQNFTFNAEYDKTIKERKEADQILANQADYQAAADQERNRMEAEAKRDKETAIEQMKGDLAKKLVEATGEATRTMTKATQEAYQEQRQGEIALQTAQQEALAIKVESARKAEAAQQMIAAYDAGGDGLMREALTKLYNGVTITARPYSPSDRVDRMQYGVQPSAIVKPMMGPVK